MRRLNIPVPCQHHSFVLQYVVAAAALACLAFAPPATAQEACPDGLMRRADAGTGLLLLRTAVPGCYLPAPSVAGDFKVEISGAIARTVVTQRFENPADGYVEGVYLFPLPEGAAVDTLKLKIGDRLIEGVIKERQEARRIYEEAKAQGKKASLVEEERPNMFTNSVANIGPHDAITVQIEYQESLRFDSGRYHLRLPLVVAPRYSPRAQGPAQLVGYGEVVAARPDPVSDRRRIASPVVPPELGPVNPTRISVHLKTGFRLGDLVSESHSVMLARRSATEAEVTLAEAPADRDFTLSFAPAAGNAPSVSLLKEHKDDGDYLLALVAPPAVQTRVAAPREAIFIIDNSGSMGGESIVQAKAGLLLALDRLTPADRFNVIRFDDTMTMLFPRAVDANAANLARAKAYVASLEAEGGTEMLPALRAALNDATPDDTTHLRQVIFLTDGAVGNEAELFAAIGQRLGRSRLFTVGIGSAPNGYFMSGAARAGRGTYTYIAAPDQTVPRMTELFDKLEHPVMTDLAATWPGAIGGEAWPNPLPDLYAGEPVVITLKAPKLEGTLTLSGMLGGTPWKTQLDLARAETATGIERLWARNKIANLEESRVHGGDPDTIDHAVLDVALAHHLVSRLTSLVAVDVTPSRPDGATLTTVRVPLNLPAGWDFDKVFGERVRVRERRAEAVPPTLLAQLQMRASSPAAVQPNETELVLPQGATDSRLLLLLGLMLLAGGAVLLRRERVS